MLLLVACTLSAPEERDFSNLLNARGLLERGAFKDTICRIPPVVFTAATECPSYKEAEGILNFVPIIDADDLATLLALLRIGQERRFFEFLGDPKLSPLRDPTGM